MSAAWSGISATSTSRDAAATAASADARGERFALLFIEHGGSTSGWLAEWVVHKKPSVLVIVSGAV